jgi:hypothetical protein
LLCGVDTPVSHFAEWKDVVLLRRDIGKPLAASVKDASY